MSQIKMTIVKVNGQPTHLPVTVCTLPKGCDRINVDNIYEFRTIHRIDRTFHRDQPNVSFR